MCHFSITISIIIWCIQGVLFAQNITKGPYLANPAETSISIRWETDQMVDGWVYYELDKTYSDSTNAILIGQKFSHYLYESNLKALQPGKKYQYRVKCENTYHSTSYFKTTPGKDEPIKFVAMGDSRSNPHIFKAVLDRVNDISPDLIISMGDLVENGGNYSQWEEFYFGVASEVINHIPLLSTLGDHEGDGDNGELFRYFLYPDQDVNNLWFSFDYGPAHFVSLDYRHPYNEKMIELFKNDISHSQAKWKFVYYHRPSYNLGGHRSVWGKDTWPKLFRKYQVDIVFAGHSHMFERFYPIRPSSQPESWPVTYITTAGAGAGLYDITKHPFLAMTESVNHFSYIQIQDDELQFTAFLNDGSILDQFSISKHNGEYDSKYLNLVKPQEELDVLTMFASITSPTLNSIPLIDEPAKTTFELKSSEIASDINFMIKLAPNSENFYSMEPVSGTLKDGNIQRITLNIFSKGELIIGSWGDIKPELRIEASYRTDSVEEKITGSAIDYWPDNEY